MAGEQGDHGFGKEFFFGNRTKSPVDRDWSAFFFTYRKIRSLCLCHASQEILLAGEGKRFPQVPAPGQSCSTAPGRLNSWERWGSEGKAALPAWKKWHRGNVLHLPSPAPQSHYFAVLLCLFNSVSCLWTPPETCYNLNMLSSTSAQELPPKSW